MIKMCVCVQLGSFCVLWSFGGSLFIFQKLYPDPILKLNRIIGFGGATMRCVSNTHKRKTSGVQKWTIWKSTFNALIIECTN